MLKYKYSHCLNGINDITSKFDLAWYELCSNIYFMYGYASFCRMQVLINVNFGNSTCCFLDFAKPTLNQFQGL